MRVDCLEPEEEKDEAPQFRNKKTGKIVTMIRDSGPHGYVWLKDILSGREWRKQVHYFKYDYEPIDKNQRNSV